MNFRDRLDLAQQLLLEKRVPNAEHGNNMHAFLRLMGVPIRPPYFYGFAFNALFYGASYIVALSALLLIAALLVNQSISTISIVDSLPLIGLLSAVLGVGKGISYERRKRKYELPAWDALHQPTDVFD